MTGNTLSHSTSPVCGRWFIAPMRRPAPRWRLVCFPYAGAGASIYFSWAKYLSQREIELWNVQYPGRETRLADAPAREFPVLVQQLTGALRPLEAAGVPLAFFGHSLGAVLAHEVACQLFRQDRSLPVGLFLSGRNAPSHRREPPRLHHLPPEELLDAVAEFGNLSEAIRNEPELVELLIPALRADFALLHDYHQRWNAKCVVRLPCQLSVFGGDQDPWTQADGLAHWQQFVCCRFRLRTYAGGHFFINEFRESIWHAIEEDLNEMGGKRAGTGMHKS
jgi:medium-chain acyl-[acyl-carrier-protein] hydrolase